eukprot:1139788-Pelagomonas_calceolata.AAC.5
MIARRLAVCVVCDLCKACRSAAAAADPYVLHPADGGKETSTVGAEGPAAPAASAGMLLRPSAPMRG